jgi:hypothetical protein
MIKSQPRGAEEKEQMEQIICEKTFGIKKISNGRYAVTTDIAPMPHAPGRYYNSPCLSLTYKKSETALQRSEQFVRGAYKDFINFQGNNVHFIFKNMGLIE